MSRLKQDEIPSNLEAKTEPVQYHCDYCRKDLSNMIRIRCAVCSDFDLCIECFIVGVELREHKNYHDYRVIDNMHFPFFCENWSADEEQLLLEGLEKCGIGNWPEVAEEVSTKTSEEVRDHYEKYYFASKLWPLPDYSDLLGDRQRVMLLNSGRYNTYERKEGVINKEISDKKKEKAKPAPPIDPKENGKSGYMPMRDEFETEMWHDVEKTYMNLSFDPNDTEEEREMKFQLAEVYCWRLRERARAREFVISRNLHDEKEQDRVSKSRDKDMKELDLELKRFMRILSNEEYNAMLSALAQERLVKHRITQLQGYRRRGVKTLADASRYDDERKRREADRRKDPAMFLRKLQRRQQQKLDLSGQSGVDLLTMQERILCESYHILPQQYLVAKEVLIQEYVLSGDAELSLDRAYVLVDMDQTRVEKIHSFLIGVGWLNHPQHLNPVSVHPQHPSHAPSARPAQVAPAKVKVEPQVKSRVPVPAQAKLAPSSDKKRRLNDRSGEKRTPAAAKKRRVE